MADIRWPYLGAWIQVIIFASQTILGHLESASKPWSLLSVSDVVAKALSHGLKDTSLNIPEMSDTKTARQSWSKAVFSYDGWHTRLIWNTSSKFFSWWYYLHQLGYLCAVLRSQETIWNSLHWAFLVWYSSEYHTRIERTQRLGQTRPHFSVLV